MLPLSVFSINLLSSNMLLLSALLIIAAVLVAKLGARLGAPALLLFIGIGLLAGRTVSASALKITPWGRTWVILR